MIKKEISFSLSGLKKFASRDDYIAKTSKFFGNRLVKLALDEMELKKRISNYNNPIIRDASKNATILFNGHVGIVSTVNELNTAAQVDPEEYVFFRCRAIDAGGFEKNGNASDLHGANDNGDYFSAEELLKHRVFSTRDGEEKKVHAFETFVGKLFFTNHKNDDVSQGKGMIINAYYDLEDNCAYTDIMVDAVANPELARAIKDGYLKDVSMGCAVEWSECSVCGNKANNVNEYCDHIQNYKGRKFGGKEVYEINHDLKFIEISAVTEGAFKNCTIDQILSQDEILNTAKEMKEAYKEFPLKAAYQTVSNCKKVLSKILKDDLKKVANAKSKGLVVEASEEHLGQLYQALDTIREVIMDMIQLENIDYDYVSDLTKIMKDLQSSIFDLASAGFNEENSETDLGVGVPGSTGGRTPIEEKFQQGQAQNNQQNDNVSTLPQKPNNQNVPQKEEFPLAAMKVIKKEDLHKIAEKLNEVIIDCDNVLKLSSYEKDYNDNDVLEVKNSFQYDPQDSQMIHVAELSPIKMEYNVNEDIIKTYWGRKLVKSQSLNEINQVAAALIRNNPENALERRVKQFKDHTRSELSRILQSRGKIMPKQVKTAATDKIIYRQLTDDLNGSNFKHVRDTHEVDMSILEGMLDSLDTTSETGPSEYMLEGKVQTGKTSNERINDVHKVDKLIGEGQMTENKRRVANDAAGIEYGTGEAQFEQRKGEFTSHRNQPDRADIDLPITEGQMDEADDLGNKRLEYALLSITEEQMKSKRECDETAGTSGQTKWSFNDKQLSVTAKDVADLIITALTNVVVKDSIPPARVIKACSNLEDKTFGYFNANNSIQKFSSPVRTEQDIVDRVALRIAEINHNYGLTSNDKNLNEKWDNVLRGVVSAFTNNSDKFIKVLANKSNAYIQKLSSVISGDQEIKTAEEETSQTLASILDEYLPDDRPSEIVTALMSPKDFEVIDGASEFSRILNENDGELYYKKASELFKNLIIHKAGVELQDSDIIVQSIDKEKLEDNDVLNIKFKITASDEDFEKMISANEKCKDNDDDECDDDDDDDDDDKLSESKAMSVAIKKVFAQQAPGGFVGGPQFGGAQDQSAPAAPAAGGGDAGLGAMSTPPPSDFSPLDDGGDGEGGGEDAQVGTPQMPGLRCPTCGSMEIEEIDNNSHCKVCQQDWSTEVNVKLINNVANDEEGDIEEVEEGGDNFEQSEDAQNELGAAPTAQTQPAPPPMASSKNTMKKISGIPTRIKYTEEPIVMACNTTVTASVMNGFDLGKVGHKMAPGHRCPDCGSLHVHCEDSVFQCVSCGTKGKFKITKNAKDSRFADVTIAYLSKGSVNKPVKSSSIVKKFITKIASAKDVLGKRTASNSNDKSVEESLNDVLAELHEDGYSIKDAEILRDVIVESMLSENIKNTNSEDNIMPIAQDKLIEMSDEENNELDDALSPSNDEENGFGGSENLSDETEGPEEMDSDISMDDEIGGVEDIVVLEDEEDNFNGEDLSGGNDMISIDVNTPDDDVHIEIDDSGHVEIDQGYADEEGMEDMDGMEGMEDESPDYLGEEEDLGDDGMEGEEDDSLADVSPDLDEDFTNETDDDGPEGEGDVEGDVESEGDELETENANQMIEMSQSDREVKMLRTAALMNTKSIQRYQDGFGSTQNWDLVCRAIGKNPNQIRKEAKQIRDAEDIVKAKTIDMNNPTAVIRNFLLKKSQSTNVNQTQPLSVEDKVEVEIPRKKEVGFSQTKYDPIRGTVGGAGGGVTEVKTDKYERGKGGETGGETSVVPRSKGDSGISGISKADFCEEKANKATSGNPDTYFQSVQKNIEPTPKSSEKNRVRASSIPQLMKFAKQNNIPVNAIKVKKVGGMYVAAYKNKVCKWGNLGKNLTNGITLDYPEVTVKISANGKVNKQTKQPVLNKTASKKGLAKFACLKQTASSVTEAVKIFKVAQNVPEQFIECADFETEFVVRDKRVQGPEGTFVIRKSKKQ